MDPEGLIREEDPEDGIEETDPGDGAGATEEIDPEQFIPIWLAALVLVLLLVVMGMGGYIARDLLSDPKASTPEELEIEKWEDAVAQNPDDTQAILALGYAYQQAERYEDALERYDEVLEYWPSDTAALYNKGIVLMELGREKEAEETLWKVLDNDPNHVLAAKALGEYYAEKGHYRSVLAAVKPVVEEQESSADLQYLMGLAYENLGHEDWAEARYRLALKYYPDMPEAREGLERLGVTP